MRKFIILFVFVSCCFFYKCDSKVEPNFRAEINGNTNVIKVDTSLIEVADLPVRFDSISFLIHPIGYFKKDSREKYSFLKSSDNSTYNDVSNFYNDVISGQMSNLLFQNFDSEELIKLTEKNITIQKVIFLRDLFNSTKNEVFVYEIIDTDTNKDNKLDYLDGYSLFISNSDGSNFRKISKLNHQLLTYKFMKSNNNLYFKTIETKEESVFFHYYHISLSDNKNLVEEYFPIK